jgi:hypothetical protein
MEPHAQNSNRQAGRLIAPTDNGGAYEYYVVVTQARQARAPSERERVRTLSRASGESFAHTHTATVGERFKFPFAISHPRER